MAAKQTAITQANAKRLFKAAREAGFSRATLRTFPDGRIEIVGETEETPATELSPFEQWKAKHAG